MSDAGALFSSTWSDVDLARRLTAAVRATHGIATVFPSRPILHAATEGIAEVLELEEPEILIDVDRTEDSLTITAHVATLAGGRTPQALTAAAETIRGIVALEGLEAGAILVKARFIDDAVPAEGSAAEAEAEAAAAAAAAAAAEVAAAEAAAAEATTEAPTPPAASSAAPSPSSAAAAASNASP